MLTVADNGDETFGRWQGQILRGERYTLLRNNGARWDVKDAAGHKLNAPAVCFMIPPTDPESVNIADKWVRTRWRINSQSTFLWRGTGPHYFEEAE